jgi:predicted CoA-binding protein
VDEELSDEGIRTLLGKVQRIAVLGAKAGAAEDAFRVPRYLQARGFRILPVNPKLEAVLGERCWPDLGSLPEVPELVNVFRAAAHIPGHVEEILRLAPLPRGVWLQLGIRHDEAAARLRDAGIQVVQDRCIMVEHARLCGPRPETGAAGP